MSSPAAPAPASPDALKAEGNAHFSAGRHAEAILSYRTALDLGPGDSLRALLHSNLAAVHIVQRDWASALAEARFALAIDDGLTKAHFRAGVALAAMQRPAEAVKAMAAAARLDPKNAAVLAALGEAEAHLRLADTTGSFETLDDFVGAFGRCRDVRLRLVTLATFWNALGDDARWATFRRLLELLLGPSAVEEPPPPGLAGAHISQYDRTLLAPLPMDNYVDVVVPGPWVAFFGAQPGPAAQVAVLEAIWALCDVAEQRLIIGDMQSFFRRPDSEGGGEEGDSEPESGDSGEPEDDGAEEPLAPDVGEGPGARAPPAPQAPASR